MGSEEIMISMRALFVQVPQIYIFNILQYFIEGRERKVDDDRHIHW